MQNVYSSMDKQNVVGVGGLPLILTRQACSVDKKIAFDTCIALGVRLQNVFKIESNRFYSAQPLHSTTGLLEAQICIILKCE